MRLTTQTDAARKQALKTAAAIAAVATDDELWARINRAAKLHKNDWPAHTEMQRRQTAADAAWWASMQSTTDTPVTASTPTPTGHHEAGCECGNWTGPASICLL